MLFSDRSELTNSVSYPEMLYAASSIQARPNNDQIMNEFYYTDGVIE